MTAPPSEETVLRTTVLDPVGVELADLAPGAADVPRLRELLAEHGVAVRGQDLDDAAFVAFLAGFGELVFTPGETPVPGFPDLNVVTNVGRATPPRSVFHVDTSYVRRPPAYTALRAVDIPERGGETLFTNQYRAYDTLPDDVRATLDGRTITHRVSGVDPGEGHETEAEHPVFRRHPVSERTSLFLSTPERCVAVSGMDATRSTEMIEYLYRHSTADANTHRHTWSPGDVVMWDNGCVLHRADHDGVVGDRTMHRGTVAG
ncbi:TauD/TfdA dioxygenase family protein [Pseudonocardia saturnea]